MTTTAYLSPPETNLMDSFDIQLVLEANIGKPVAITFNGATESVIVISVDDDGFLCRPLTSAQDESSEFWLAFADTTCVDPFLCCA